MNERTRGGFVDAPPPTREKKEEEKPPKEEPVREVRTQRRGGSRRVSRQRRRQSITTAQVAVPIQEFLNAERPSEITFAVFNGLIWNGRLASAQFKCSFCGKTRQTVDAMKTHFKQHMEDVQQNNFLTESEEPGESNEE